ncbi:hypothetical protein MS3_00004199 [Schistosoma haematobium]|uniref:Rhodopsin n=2 Tax=Schistosoma TaxID=6181 RepID=A0A095A2W7_SCHHA|nr:hypothetical protein MS3_00004199 [Schistosoma haematobium]CAH8664228.1 unnamed protein product [Schistosoma curassoni]KAH9592177.1 hypothetical protein MS3_00004199 [Schistosoma haematobium]CAH8675861.1 unnamed protein product [Schistosoma haematobium]CAH8679468.1 unnamed protein product [Schistosoma haematobium]VDP33637.1 unnamed protein product [Schistosoma curassoni]
MSSNRTIEMLRPVMKDFDSIVLPYWHKFEQPHPYYQYAIGLFIAVVGITGVCLNLLVIIFFTMFKSLRTPSNILVVNLAISDLGFSAVIGFPLKTMAAFNNFWPWGKIACDIYGLAGGLFGFVSLSTIAAVALDRYLVIATPFESVFQTTPRRTLLLMLFLWLWSLIWTIPPLFGFGRYVTEGYQTSCTMDYISTDLNNRLFNIGLFGFGFLCPLFLSLFCYARIILIVRSRGKDFIEMAASSKGTNQKEKGANVSSSKSDTFVLKSSAILLGVYLLCWTPYSVVCLMALIGYADYITPLMVELPCLCAKTAAVWDPCIYAFRYPKFRVLLQRQFGFLRLTKNKTDQSSRGELSTVCQIEE